MRTIDADALKNTIIGFCGKCQNIITKYENGVPDGNCAIHHILNMIDNAPTVEVSEKVEDCTSIVCGDCVLGDCDNCEDLRGDTK